MESRIETQKRELYILCFSFSLARLLLCRSTNKLDSFFAHRNKPELISHERDSSKYHELELRCSSESVLVDRGKGNKTMQFERRGELDSLTGRPSYLLASQSCESRPSDLPPSLEKVDFVSHLPLDLSAFFPLASKQARL